MKLRIITPFVLFLFLAPAGYAQDSSCAYTFTYPKAQFSFCVTAWGTLASIQSPIGVNHLDAANPVEGWSAFIRDDAGGNDGSTVIPGLGFFGPLPTVRQPNGPGTLPLIFDYDENDREYVTAAPHARAIFLTLRIRSCSDCYWNGTVSRVANIRADGSSTGNFVHSPFSAFAYVEHGVMLSVPDTQCAGIDPNGASADPYFDCTPNSAPFNGPGAVFGSFIFESDRGKPMRMTATYRVF